MRPEMFTELCSRTGLGWPRCQIDWRKWRRAGRLSRLFDKHGKQLTGATSLTAQLYPEGERTRGLYMLLPLLNGHLCLKSEALWKTPPASSRKEQAMTHSLAKWLEEWAAIVTTKPFLAAVLCQSLSSSSSAVLPCRCRAGIRAILKSLILLILDREQHGSTAYLRSIYCIGCFHLAIHIHAIKRHVAHIVSSSRDLAVLPCHCDVKPFL